MGSITFANLAGSLSSAMLQQIGYLRVSLFSRDIQRRAFAPDCVNVGAAKQELLYYIEAPVVGRLGECRIAELLARIYVSAFVK